MGLVAKRAFIGDGGRRYQPGERCDEALTWRYTALRACLSQGWIEDQDGSVKRHYARRPMARSALAPLDVSSGPGPIAVDSDVEASESEDDALELVEDGENERIHAEVGASPPAASFPCVSCGRKFATERAVKIHRARASCA